MRWAAIHQPNLFARLGTLRKIFVSDCWIVLSHVQFNARDYQHRCLLTDRREPERLRWCTVPVHRPIGRSTRIADLRIVDPIGTARVVGSTIRYHLAGGAGWSLASPIVGDVVNAIAAGDLVRADVASMERLLRLVGWSGQVVLNDDVPVSGKTERLVALTTANACGGYVCGAGGARYLRPDLFTSAGIAVRYFQTSSPQGLRMDDVPDLHANSLAVLCQFGLDYFVKAVTSE